MNDLVHADMPIEERMACDKVEKYFENWYYNLDKESENFCFKYGLDWKNTQGKNISKLKTSILTTPDYICYDSLKDDFFFVEVKKCGYFFCLKQIHLDYYKRWQNNYPFKFWIYNSNQKIVFPTLNQVEQLINNNNYNVTTYAEKRKDPKDCKLLMWEIPFKDIYESM